MPYIQHRMKPARTKGTFWQDHKFANPATKKIGSRSMYCERLDDRAVCASIHKS